MAKLSDIVVKHQIYVQRVSKTLEDIAADTVSASDRKLILMLKDKLPSIGSFSNNRATAKQLAEVQEAVSNIRTAALGLAQNKVLADTRELAENEAAFAGRLISEALPEGGAILKVAGQELNNLVRYGVFSGSTIDQWFKGFESADLSRIMSTVRAGVANGATTEAIARTLSGTAAAGFTDGVLNTSRQSARTIARTVTNGVSNQARLALYEKNSDVIYAVVYSATLDSRTSPICRGLDGTAWKVPEETNMIQTPPQHPNCRSTLVPAPTKDDIDSTRPAQRENFEARAEDRYNAKQKDKGNPKRFQDLSAATKRRYTLQEQKIYKKETGKNPFFKTKNNYEEFFDRQSAEFQRDILGATRYELYKKGGMDLKEFTDFKNRDQFTIAELRKKDKQAFIDAGLNGKKLPSGGSSTPKPAPIAPVKPAAPKKAKPAPIVQKADPVAKKAIKKVKAAKAVKASKPVVQKKPVEEKTTGSQPIKTGNVVDFGSQTENMDVQDLATLEAGDTYFKNKYMTTNGLPADEKLAVLDYTGDSTIINDKLRKGTISKDTTISKIKKRQAEAIDRAVKRSVNDEEIFLYRGVPLDVGNGLLEKGSILSDKGFTSTSIGSAPADQFARKHIIKIKYPKGKNLLYIGNESRNPNEFEMLLPRNLKLQTTKVTERGRRVEILMDVIEN